MLRFWKTLNILYERLLLIFMALVLLICVWCAYDNYYVYSSAADETVTKYKPVPGVSSAVADSPITEDMVAWLTIDGTSIDYPVMQASDNVKYLNTDPFGAYSLSGSIFLDSACSPDFSDDYSLIYGHHMELGKMFGALDDFLKESYLKKHTSGTLMVGRNAETVYDIEVFAAMKTTARADTVFSPGKGDIRSYIQSSADVFLGDGGGRIIGLSTCAGDSPASRTVVFCRIIDR
ncbi:MAG: class B sortase [Ruminococcus sp.]|nr:class B sortase [Ruminococcus sp.]